LGEIDGKESRIFTSHCRQGRHSHQSNHFVGDGIMITDVEFGGIRNRFHAKPTVKEKQKVLSSLGLDGVLYLLGYHDRHIDDMMVGVKYCNTYNKAVQKN
jgi:phosphoserine phosphatase